MKYIAAILICLLLIVIGVSITEPATASLSWDKPVINADGTQLKDLVGYKIYYGIESGNYTGSVDVGNVLTYQINNLIAGTKYYFVATAYDTTGNESQYSTEISKVSSSAGKCLVKITETGIETHDCAVTVL